jgi:hypothetical protein
MYLKRHGDFAKLQECVSGTGLTGEWLFLPDGCCQFVADDGGNVIWDPYEPSIRFLGEGSAAEELEREVKAVANGRFEAITKKTKKSRGNMDIRKSRNSRALRQLSDQFGLFSASPWNVRLEPDPRCSHAKAAYCDTAAMPRNPAAGRAQRC